MKIYLDTSALNRIFDDQSQARIYLESVSMELIFLLIVNQTVSIVSSESLKFETDNNPYSERRIFIEKVLENARFFQPLTVEILARAEEIETRMNIKGMDSLHLACAENMRVDYFITCDDLMIKRYRGDLIVINPTTFANDAINTGGEGENDK